MGSLYVSQELRVDGYAGFGGVGDVLYAAKATGDALVTGDLSVGGDLDVTGNITGTVVVTHPLPMSCLEGCAVSNAADAAHDITITKGRRRDSTNTVNIVLSAAITKQIDAAWAAGTNAGGIDTGAVGNTTTYWLYLIASADGTTLVDAIFSAAAPATGPALPAGYTIFRVLESWRTDGSANLPLFLQKQGWVYLNARPAERAWAAFANTNRTLVTMTYTPENTLALINAKSAGSVAGPYYAWVRDTAATDAAASVNNSNLAGITGMAASDNEIQVWVDASRQIAIRGDSTNLYLGLNAVAYRSDVGEFDYV